MSKNYTFYAPGAGPSHEWENDHIFIKVGSADSAGAYTVVEDNLKSAFALGLHLHRAHAETFYILEGSVDFYLDDEWITARAGASLHIPPGVPHAAKVSDDAETARMLMIFQPAGFDLFLSELAAMTKAELADETKVAALSAKYDIIQLGPIPGAP
ncbi:MAG: cupin domain-containing protein [Pseudomonadota bacterium]